MDFRNTITQNGTAVSLATHTHNGLIPSGTTFPGSPTTNQLFFRTDIGDVCQFDGSNWLGRLETCTMSPFSTASPYSGSMRAMGIALNFNVVVVDVTIFNGVLATNNATNYWTMTIQNDGISMSSMNTSGQAAGNYYSNVISFSATVRAIQLLSIFVTKTLNPGNLYINASCRFRRVY